MKKKLLALCMAFVLCVALVLPALPVAATEMGLQENLALAVTALEGQAAESTGEYRQQWLHAAEVVRTLSSSVSAAQTLGTDAQYAALPGYGDADQLAAATVNLALRYYLIWKYRTEGADGQVTYNREGFAGMLRRCYHAALLSSLMQAALEEQADLLEKEGTEEASSAAAFLRGAQVDGFKLSLAEYLYETEYVGAAGGATPEGGHYGAFRPMPECVSEVVALLVKNYDLASVEERGLLSDALVACYAQALGDRFASYYSAEGVASYEQSQETEYVGIGVSVTQRKDGYIDVLNVTEASPAQEAGILPGDVLVAVEGVDVASMLYADVIDLVRGEEGTSVSLRLRRGEQEYTVSVTRRKMINYTVTHKMLLGEAKIGYVAITQFTKGTFDQFVDAVEDLQAQGAQALVFDLRNNPGGLLNAVVAILGWILPDSNEAVPDGTVVKLTYRNEARSLDITMPMVAGYAKSVTDRYDGLTDHYLDLPMTVLCNGNTASAGELFTSSLKDWGVATVIGEKTYGKGVGQSGYYLVGARFDANACNYYDPYYSTDGTLLAYSPLLNLTSFLYAPAKSPNYEGVGITPDLTVPLPEGEEGKNIYQLSPEKDTQLQKALSVLEEELETRNPLPEEQQTLLLWVFLGAAAVVLLAGVSISGALLWRSRHRQ